MVKEKDIPLAYIKKAEYPGSDQGIRFMLKTVKITDDETGEEKKSMRVSIWPEPYALAKTDPNLVTEKEFPLSEEGKREAVDWINAQHAEHPELYHR